MNPLQKLFLSLQKINLAQPEEKIIAEVVPLVQNAVTVADTWLEKKHFAYDEAQGFGSHLIAENPDHTLPVIISAWPHTDGTPPHDHDTWAVIANVIGVEKNTHWRRLDDGSKPNYAKIELDHVKLCKKGDIVTMKTGEIHSVSNPEAGIAISLHVYGKHFNYTKRHQFDPINNTVKPFIVKQTEHEKKI